MFNAESDYRQLAVAKIGSGETASLSEAVWSFRWNNFLPKDLEGDFSVVRVGWDEASQFVQSRFREIFNAAENCGPFGREKLTPAKERYYQIAGDFFLIQKGSLPVALATGTLLDWSSYYFRNMAILPSYQGFGIYPKFSQFLFEILAALGVERVEGDISPTNQQHLHIINKLGWMQTGMVMTDRWGAFIHITKFLNSETESFFGKTFCGTEASDRRQKARRVVVESDKQ